MMKKRLFREEVKDRHTSHWDLDMMSREELEEMMAGTKNPESNEVEQSAVTPTKQSD